MGQQDVLQEAVPVAGGEGEGEEGAVPVVLGQPEENLSRQGVDGGAGELADQRIWKVAFFDGVWHCREV
jgi:hypothetical protein